MPFHCKNDVALCKVQRVYLSNFMFQIACVLTLVENKFDHCRFLRLRKSALPYSERLFLAGTCGRLQPQNSTLKKIVFYVCQNAGTLKHELGQVDTQHTVPHFFFFYNKWSYFSQQSYPLNIESESFSRRNNRTLLNAFDHVSICKCNPYAAFHACYRTSAVTF